MEYLWTPQPKGKFLFEGVIFFITCNRRQVQFLSFWFIGAFIAEHNHLSQVHFSSSRWPFGPFGRTVYLGLSRGLCTKSCTKCRKRDRIIHNLMKRQFAVYRSIAPMMNQDITIKWANRASPHDEAHRLKSIDSTPFINPVWLIWHHIDTKLVQKRLYKKAESYPLTDDSLLFFM